MRGVSIPPSLSQLDSLEWQDHTLGLNRSTLRYKLRDLGLSVERTVG
jgi:hypothetical protein